MASPIRFFCPTTTPNPCEASLRGFVIPLQEKMTKHSRMIAQWGMHIQMESYLLQCPYCHVFLIQCENCFGLMEDWVEMKKGDFHDEHIVCRRCGFLNILGKIRQILHLNPFRPMNWDQVRIIQRCISENLYFDHKSKKLEEITQRSKENTKLKEELSKIGCILQNQTMQLQDPRILREDFEKMNAWNFTSCCWKFTESHLKMLRALYEEEKRDEMEEMFVRIGSFLEKLPDIIALKSETEVADDIWIRVKRAKKTNDQHDTSTNISKAFDHDIASTSTSFSVDNVINHVLQSRFVRLRKLLSFSTKPFLSLLPEINKELHFLYDSVKEKYTDFSASPNQSYFIHFSDPSGHFQERFKKENAISAVQNKITLWRLLYQSLTASLL